MQQSAISTVSGFLNSFATVCQFWIRLSLQSMVSPEWIHQLSEHMHLGWENPRTLYEVTFHTKKIDSLKTNYDTPVKTYALNN
jgi:hypothetical protein